MGNCARWNVMELAEGLRRKWRRSQLRTAPCLKCHREVLAHVRSKAALTQHSWVKVSNQISTAASIFAAFSHNYQFLPSHKLGWRIPLQSWRWWKAPGCPRPTVTNVPCSPQKSAVMCFSLLSWRSLVFCMLGHTDMKVKHTAFLLKRAFPSCTKYGSNISHPLVFPRVIWGIENSGGGYSLVSTPHCFPPTVGKARAGRMGRTGLEYLAAPTEHPPEWVSRLWAASVQGTWHTVTKRCLCGVSLLVPNEHVPELWPCSAIQPLAGQWFLWAWASKSLTARERWWHSFWCSAASLGQSHQIKHHGIPGMKTSDPQTQSPGIIPGMRPQP